MLFTENRKQSFQMRGSSPRKKRSRFSRWQTRISPDRAPASKRYALESQNRPTATGASQAAIRALMPNAARNVWLRHPMPQPSPKAMPSLRPFETPIDRTNRLSGPGESVISSDALKKPKNCSGESNVIGISKLLSCDVSGSAKVRKSGGSNRVSPWEQAQNCNLCCLWKACCPLRRIKGLLHHTMPRL